MDNYQAKQVFEDEVISRWPDFLPTKRILDDWTGLFKHFEVPDVANAVKQYNLTESKSFRKPNLAKIRAILNAMQGVRPKKLQPHGRPKNFILCKEAGRSALKGSFYSIAGIKSENPDTIRTMLVNSALQYEIAYGGKWVPIILEDEHRFGDMLKFRLDCEAERLAEKRAKIAERKKQLDILRGE